MNPSIVIPAKAGIPLVLSYPSTEAGPPLPRG
jgi:hypothetical protein